MTQKQGLQILVQRIVNLNIDFQADLVSRQVIYYFKTFVFSDNENINQEYSLFTIRMVIDHFKSIFRNYLLDYR